MLCTLRFHRVPVYLHVHEDTPASTSGRMFSIENMDKRGWRRKPFSPPPCFPSASDFFTDCVVRISGDISFFAYRDVISVDFIVFILQETLLPLSLSFSLDATLILYIYIYIYCRFRRFTICLEVYVLPKGRALHGNLYDFPFDTAFVNSIE